MLRKVISGGQSGADIGGLRAAKAAGLETGGLMPRQWLTEDGPRPEYAELYGMAEHADPGYPPRTRANIRESDGTIIFSPVVASRGTRLAMGECLKLKKPAMYIYGDGSTTASDVASWILEHGIAVVNIGGNRESSCPGLAERVERFLGRVFERLKNNSL